MANSVCVSPTTVLRYSQQYLILFLQKRPQFMFLSSNNHCFKMKLCTIDKNTAECASYV